MKKKSVGKKSEASRARQSTFAQNNFSALDRLVNLTDMI